MFTGLVETVGRVDRLDRRGEAVRLAIGSTLPTEEMSVGESVAVDGVCLTVVGLGEERFEADVIPETLRRSTLGEATVGTPVNLERALRLGDRLGGHLVQGHVDATVEVLEVLRRDDYRLRLGLVPPIHALVAEKGSIALQGVSLTIAGVSDTDFEVALIPQTLQGTTLGDVEAGDHLNVEVDLMARYLERMLESTGKR